MLSAATAGIIRAADGRGAPAVMPIGRTRRPLGSITLPDGAMWPIRGAPAHPHGNHMCHSVPERGRTTLLSGECPFKLFVVPLPPTAEVQTALAELDEITSSSDRLIRCPMFVAKSVAR